MALPFTLRCALGEESPPESHLAYPAFDPASPDAVLLDAYEKHRSWTSWVYSQDPYSDVWGRVGNGTSDYAEALFTRGDELTQPFEAVVIDASPVTLPGVATQLCLTLARSKQDRETDTAMMMRGPSGFAELRSSLEWTDQLVLSALMSVLRIEWEQALSEYNRSTEDFLMAIRLNDALFDFQHPLPDIKDDLEKVREIVEANVERASNHPQVNRLMKTLAPDAEALLVKTEVLAREGRTQDALPWLARDIAHVTGCLDGSENPFGRFDYEALIPAPISEEA